MLKQNKTKAYKTNKMTKIKKKKKNEKRSEILSIVINELARVAHLRLRHVIRVGLKSIGHGSSVCSRSVFDELRV